MTKYELIKKFITFIEYYLDKKLVKLGCPGLYDVCSLFYDDINPKWQPIETAPRDGTEILVYCPAKHKLKQTIICVSWRKYTDEFGKHDFWEIINIENGYGDIIHQPPTHWMTLPDIPTQEK